jgi:hypothetical protein
LHFRIVLAILLPAVVSVAGSLDFVEPVADTVVEYGSELEIVVRNDTNEIAPVYILSAGTYRELFKAFADRITKYVLDTNELEPGVYKLEAGSGESSTVNVSIDVKAAGPESELPKVYPLPNPFNLSTLSGEVTFVNTPAGSVITVFDMGGREVVELTESYTWNGRNERGDLVSSGTYVYYISSPGGLKFTGKLAVVK